MRRKTMVVENNIWETATKRARIGHASDVCNFVEMWNIAELEAGKPLGPTAVGRRWGLSERTLFHKQALFKKLFPECPSVQAMTAHLRASHAAAGGIGSWLRAEYVWTDDDE